MNTREVLDDVIARVERAGYHVPTAEVELPLLGMTCANCANTIQRRLNKVDGVLDATVNYASERATVRLCARHRRAGPIWLPPCARPAMTSWRLRVMTTWWMPKPRPGEAEIRHQWKRLMVGVVFTIPLFLLSMSA